MAVGYWSGREELKRNWSEDRTWAPDMAVYSREAACREWRKAVERTFDWV